MTATAVPLDIRPELGDWEEMARRGVGGQELHVRLSTYPGKITIGGKGCTEVLLKVHKVGRRISVRPKNRGRMTIRVGDDLFFFDTYIHLGVADSPQDFEAVVEILLAFWKFNSTISAARKDQHGESFGIRLSDLQGREILSRVACETLVRFLSWRADEIQQPLAFLQLIGIHLQQGCYESLWSLQRLLLARCTFDAPPSSWDMQSLSSKITFVHLIDMDLDQAENVLCFLKAATNLKEFVLDSMDGAHEFEKIVLPVWKVFGKQLVHFEFRVSNEDTTPDDFIQLVCHEAILNMPNLQSLVLFTNLDWNQAQLDLFWKTRGVKIKQAMSDHSSLRTLRLATWGE